MLDLDLTFPFEKIAQDLQSTGISILPNFIGSEILSKLEIRLAELTSSDFKQAGIGRLTEHEQNQKIRRDKIHWLDANNELEAAWLDNMAELKTYLNRRLFMGLFSYESHFAVYPPGAFYKKHVDAFKGKANRVLTTVLYLNQSWSAKDGGELMVYNPNNHEQILTTVTPSYGTLVTFLSDEFPHEVLVANKKRYSVAGWFRVNTSINHAIDPPR
ncbi:2OG-Fe(II) oxygenase [Pseudoalteromonas peptidolytica]|uniref:SM-20-related protein n=1 Tax=Pseudoalteromonas peptidolytica F12-50-A1 TaxID=1315280 RepID=A0A8I0MZR0_9GAMM|nr:2OG-Fe(II) oxygenase [Pseudoalteromonas peptidolytica]MBE0348443.1 SM-20-related protein [Pseudoalteromonas peptidolytica F12-50-A1]NLR15034.1 2OG-Fe(II) oxygenase [Pseudoalteromonas peptidolytica]GEK10325.1 prolyl 4-hydroxylase subunit alpha [Pseudoalteromonas peptidolytica]